MFHFHVRPFIKEFFVLCNHRLCAGQGEHLKGRTVCSPGGGKRGQYPHPKKLLQE